VEVGERRSPGSPNFIPVANRITHASLCLCVRFDLLSATDLAFSLCFIEAVISSVGKRVKMAAVRLKLYLCTMAVLQLAPFIRNSGFCGADAYDNHDSDQGSCINASRIR